MKWLENALEFAFGNTRSSVLEQDKKSISPTCGLIYLGSKFDDNL
jgi:hypothetical protein